MTTHQDTVTAPPPGDRLGAARWLVERHPALQRLLQRVPGLIDTDGDPDVDLLAATFTEYEQYVAAWNVYEYRNPAPRDELRFEQWRAAGPRTGALVACISCMSETERARLRMVATFAVDRVAISVADLATVDASGRALLTDWTLAVRTS